MTPTKNESLPELPEMDLVDLIERELRVTYLNHDDYKVTNQLVRSFAEAAVMVVTAQIKGEAALTREAPTDGVVNDAAYIALQEILASHCNDNHRPKAFYIAARAIASIDTPPAPQRLAQGEVWTAEMVADVHRRGDELHQRITQPPHQDRGEVIEPIGYRYRHPDGLGGWHDWIMVKDMPSKTYPGSQYEPMYGPVQMAASWRSGYDTRDMGSKLKCIWPDCGHDTNQVGYSPGCTGEGCRARTTK